MKKMIVALCCVVALIPAASAHPGKTDADGGHYDTSTGEYHYHHGFPTHLHTNGVCPYGFEDRTGENSGSSSESVSPTIAAAQAAVAASGEVELAIGDYGPEAEEDFESKREAYMYGFSAALEYARDEDIDGNAYHAGYDVGYEDGYRYGTEDNYDETHDSAYQEGYEDGYRDGLCDDPSAPNNDLIDRSEVAGTSSYPQKEEKKSFINTQYIELYVAGFIVAIVLLKLLFGFIADKRLKNKHR